MNWLINKGKGLTKNVKRCWLVSSDKINFKIIHEETKHEQKNRNKQKSGGNDLVTNDNYIFIKQM